VRYLLRTPEKSVFLDERPSQESVKLRGVGEYLLCKDDGQVLKELSVTRNRNGNLAISGRTPDTLSGMSELNLNRLIKYYERIVKIWPEQARAVNSVRKQLETRAARVAEAE
jgi:hypothetical protein